MRIFYVLMGLYAASHLYIFFAARRAFGPGRYLWVVGFFLFCMAVAWAIRIGRMPLAMREDFQVVSFVWMGYAIMLLFCLLGCDAIGLLLRLGARLIGGDAGLFSAARASALGFMLSVPLFCWSLYDAQVPRILHLDVATPCLPAGSKPVEIVQVSDLHIGALIGPGALERMRRAIAADGEPDLLLLTGDLVDGNMDEREADAAVVRSFPGKLKLAVTGNHEAYHGVEQSLRFMERCGFRVLRADAVDFAGIRIVGVDDDNFAQEAGTAGTSDDAAPPLRAALPERFVVFMRHKPIPPEEPFDLMLSGHTHGGQIWPGIFATRAVYGFDQGLTRLPDAGGKTRLLNISNGLGYWGPPIRFLTPPDVVRITVRPQAK